MRPPASASRNESAPAARHVFIDVGGNIGDSVAAFLTVGVPHVLRSGRDFDVIYVFEPNPSFADRYERFRGERFRFEFIPAAASAVDGFMVFAGQGLGGSVGGASVTAATPGAVATVDFSAWLLRTVTLDDHVVCKIDSEGAEFAIVQRMMADGTLCLCDRLSIEWHAWLGSSESPHVVEFNNPDATTEQFDDNTACKDNGGCFCHIPHLNERLPYFFCGLPYTTKWARGACALPKGTPLLEHHEKWAGWENVGRPDSTFM